ncbi:hypothetical protein ABZ901_11065 [Actinacidiphila alni]|uniref:hypothetical protein n=1 Tax=Actinacidiphila alni TaxID=380248 RepID=UPI0033F32869
MFFVSDVTSDPLLARSDKRIRWGAIVPPLGFCLAGLTGRLFNPGEETFIIEMLTFSVIGQLLVWWGLWGLHRTRGWDSDVLFYLWVGGVLTAITVTSTGILYLTPIPLIAPATAWVARARLRRGREERGAR